ncbi:imelysin family protein [Aquimarina agarilytica]|uniref:imelysin family protein n=1 Tax=Aquimarina agarilytica TaxID=1087449 RepID=UPI0002894B9A|nr:imelysin family protein [Aquimarina agarilytica]
MVKKIGILIIAFCSLLVLSCDDELKPSENNVFDAIPLLENIVDNHILPEYDAFNKDVINLVEAKNTFIANNTEANLVSLRETYLQAYTTFQAAGKYDFGLANDIRFYLNLNSHPLDIGKVENFISSTESTNLEKIEFQASQGFPAIDYLLNGLGASDSEVLAFYTGGNAEIYKDVLSKVVDRIANLTQQVVIDWNTNFATVVKSDAEFADLIYNNYVEFFERRLRSTKIDFPAGKFSGIPNSTIIESGFKPEESRRLLVEAFNSVRTFYLGTENSSSSWSKILLSLGEKGLDARIKLEFLEAEIALNALNENLATQVETDNTLMLAARDALQDLVILFKADVVSVLEIPITIVDNDGD